MSNNTRSLLLTGFTTRITLGKPMRPATLNTLTHFTKYLLKHTMPSINQAMCKLTTCNGQPPFGDRRQSIHTR